MARHGPIGAATSTHSGSDDDDDANDDDDADAADAAGDDDGADDDAADADEDEADEDAADADGKTACGGCCCVSAADSTSITSKTRQLDGTRSRYLIGSETHCVRASAGPSNMAEICKRTHKHDGVNEKVTDFRKMQRHNRKNIVGYSN